MAQNNWKDWEVFDDFIPIADYVVSISMKNRKVTETEREVYYTDDEKDDLFMKRIKTKEYDYTPGTSMFKRLVLFYLNGLRRHSKLFVNAVDFLLSESHIYEFKNVLKELSGERYG